MKWAKKTYAVVSAGLTLMVASVAGPAQARPADTSFASFQGRSINLRQGWQGATVCAVLSPVQVRCYAGDDEANYDLALVRAAETGRADLTADGRIAPLATWHGCPDNWLCIYEHPNWGGRRLQFRDDYWQSLAPYGFERQTSSWTNNQNNLGCADSGILGNGAGDNRTLSDCSASSSLGSYDNKAVDVHG